MADISGELIQLYSNDPGINGQLLQPYGDQPSLTGELVQYFAAAITINGQLEQPYGNALALSGELVQPYSLSCEISGELVQPYHIATGSINGELVQPYALCVNNAISGQLLQPYSILSGVPQIDSYSITLTVAGEQRNIISGSFNQGRDSFCIDASFVLGSQADYAACKIGDEVVLDIDGILTCNLFIESKSRTVSHGQDAYTLSCLSATAKLDAPYADDISGELSGLASDIVTGLAPGFTVNWDMTDWYIPTNTLLPADQSPLEVIRSIVNAGGGVVQTELNGSLTAQPYYPVSVPKWYTVEPNYYLSDAGQFFSVAEQFDHRDGYNVFAISDTLTSEDSLTLEEEEDNSDYRKYIRAYRVPWVDDFTLRHTGGAGVSLEDIATETETLTEQVEFTNGESSVSKPIYAIESYEWLKTNLGTITFGEDGALSSAVDAESLLSITYTTKYHRYLATDYANESVQLVVEDAAGQLLATIVPVFGESAGSDELCVIELDDEYNTDENGDAKTSFEPGDYVGFTIHHDPRATRIAKIESSAGMPIYRNQVERYTSKQMTWQGNDDSQSLTHLPSGKTTVNWYGTEGALQVTDRTVINTGSTPSVCEVEYTYTSTGYTLVPPVISLDDGESYPVLVVITLESV